MTKALKKKFGDFKMIRSEMTVNYGFVKLVVYEILKCVELDGSEIYCGAGYIEEIDEVERYGESIGDCLDDLKKIVDSKYPEYITTNPVVWDRIIYGCGPVDIRNYGEF
ncbi:hypothetical protein [Rivularia sp. UHCC 0363]|uniref:hypothetical protein n=1 Tax=Rivularia sp. UHCC 0363 TaxID=3110244 RepID=UPI002B20AC76|nr:hypothetical protein [Rivularia sp. UHCC 0363]MEA5595676.1 hypothetical protein [Rivularia sp. UHCC 0363]